MTREEERDDLRRGVELFEKLTGSHPPRLVRALVPERAHARAARRGGRLSLRLRRLQRRAALLRRRPRHAASSSCRTRRSTTTSGTSSARPTRRRGTSSRPCAPASTTSARRPRAGDGARHDDRRHPRALERPGRPRLGAARLRRVRAQTRRRLSSCAGSTSPAGGPTTTANGARSAARAPGVTAPRRRATGARVPGGSLRVIGSACSARRSRDGKPEMICDAARRGRGCRASSGRPASRRASALMTPPRGASRSGRSRATTVSPCAG